MKNIFNRRLQQYGLLVLILIASITYTYADSVDARCDIYPKGSDQASAMLACTFSQRQGYVTISLDGGETYDLSPVGDSPGNYTDQNGKAAYRQSGLGKDGLIFRLAKNSIYIYWDRAPLPPVDANKGFEKSLSQQGISFHLSSANDSSINQLSIQPGGLKIGNEAINIEINGQVTLAEIADLDANGWPEIYIYVTSAGSGSYGSLLAYAVNGGKSISPIYLPDLMADKKNSRGYMGHDEFRLVENTLVRRFPLYKAGDTNAKPTGGMRQLQYKLKAGEAGWVLKLDRAVEY